MLIDELKEQIQALEPDIQTIKQFWDNSGIEQEFSNLQTTSQQEDFWQHKNQAQISKQLSHLRSQREEYHDIIKSYQEIQELLELFAQDEKELTKLQSDIKALTRNVGSFKVSLLLSGPEDNSDCFLSINAGAGGTESQDWANMLLRMFLRFCERHGFKAQTIDYQPGEEAGIKSATLYIRGKKPYGILKSEHGVHRLVRISPFDANKRRHTSFAAVSLIPETPEIAIEIDPSDLRIDTYRASGAGGQHVNKTDSAVRITHIPSNIVVQCQNERSQLQNKETAMKMLKAKLAQKAKEEQAAELAAKTEKRKIEWGSQIRSYVLHPYKMVKDHRTNFESPQPDLVLDGDIMNFIERYLVLNN